VIASAPTPAGQAHRCLRLVAGFLPGFAPAASRSG